MDTRLHLQPGQNGTKALVKKYGDRLVSMRYRYDEEAGKRYKTVELIEETVPWRPRDSREQHHLQRALNDRVLLKVEYGETALRERVRKAGGYWMPDEKAWSITYGAAAQLDLTGRIVGDI